MILRYALIGGVCAATDFLVFGFAVKFFGLDWFWWGFLSFIIATVMNYILCISFLFKSGVRFSPNTELALIFTVSAVGLIINQSVLYVLIESIGMEELSSKVLATSSVFFWNYLSRKRFIFKTLT